MRKPEQKHPSVSPGSYQRPNRGKFLWTCRNGFETYLFEELRRAQLSPRLLGPAAVECNANMKPDFAPVFGRAGFRVTDALGKKGTVEAWTLDTPDANRLSQEVRARVEAAQVEPGKERLVLCAMSSDLIVPGDQPTAAVKRMWREGDTLSRAALKLEEALDWVGDAPSRGETCVDLGAAPGGWTQRLLTRGTRVTAIDPAKMGLEHPKLTHYKQSAFRYAPDEPIDWLFCDMAWRPLEVAQLLGKWARNEWAIRVVANLKLPMKDKWPTLDRCRFELENGGWKRVKMRQLYHDRDEVTLAATRY